MSAASEPYGFDPHRAETGATPPGPVFVSRSALAKPRAELRASDGGPLPSLRDARVRWLIVLTLLLQLYAWSRVDGYQLADSVEFMERARTFERGQQLIDAGVIRPFGFSFVFVPFFALADWFGVHDQRAVVWCVVVFQMLIGCLLVWRCMRIGARVAGSAGAIAAGLFVAANPVFLQYSTQPVSDLAAGVCVAFAIEGVLDRGSFKTSFAAGLWLSLAFVVAYKSLLVSLAVIVMVFLRDRWKHSATWRGLMIGVTLGLLAQSTLDWLMYGAFGASVSNYLVQNGGSVIGSVCLKLYKMTGLEPVARLGQWVYRMREMATADDLSAVANMPPIADMTVRGLQSPWFYVTQMPTMVVWPALCLLAAAVVRALLRPRWKPWLLVGSMCVCLFVMSNKGSKDFRLWLPLLPFVAPLVGSGWEWVSSGTRRSLPAARPLVAAAGACALIGFGVHQLVTVNVRNYGGYWTAIDWIDARAHATFAARREQARTTGELGEPAPLRVGSAYNWAVFLRSSPLIDVVKLPWQLNMWKQYERQPDGGRRQKLDDMTTIADLDVLLVHLPILKENPDLMSWVAAHFDVVGAFYDQRTYEDIGPIFVLERCTGSPDAHRFFEVVSGADADAAAARISDHRLPGRALDFVGEDGDRLQLLGVEFDSLPPQGFGWVTYHWRARAPLSRDFWAIDRVTSPDERNVWENNHEFAYGTAPPTKWAPGDVVSESYLMVPAHEPYRAHARVRPIGGAYRRGDLIPTRTWMKLQAFDPASLAQGEIPRVVAELAPARAGDARAIEVEAHETGFETPDGIQLSADGFVRVASYFVPVLAPWRLPDDGRPVPP